MMTKYEWIESDRQFFGKPNGLYDFEQHNPKEVSAKLPKLQELKNKLSRAVNTRAVNLLGKEEEQVTLVTVPVSAFKNKYTKTCEPLLSRHKYLIFY